MAFQRGDVVLIPSPFTGLSAAKIRPLYVIPRFTLPTLASWATIGEPFDQLRLSRSRAVHEPSANERSDPSGSRVPSRG